MQIELRQLNTNTREIVEVSDSLAQAMIARGMARIPTPPAPAAPPAQREKASVGPKETRSYRKR